MKFIKIDFNMLYNSVYEIIHNKIFITKYSLDGNINGRYYSTYYEIFE